jgi:hypothetical protein
MSSIKYIIMIEGELSTSLKTRMYCRSNMSLSGVIVISSSKQVYKIPNTFLKLGKASL